MWFIFINSRRGSNILTFSHLYMFMVRYYPAEEKWHTFRNHSKDTRTIFAKETGDFRDGRMIFCARREINSLCNSPSSWRCCVGSKQSGLWTKYRSHGGLAASAETRRSPKHRAGKTCRDGNLHFSKNLIFIVIALSSRHQQLSIHHCNHATCLTLFMHGTILYLCLNSIQQTSSVETLILWRKLKWKVIYIIKVKRPLWSAYLPTL